MQVTTDTIQVPLNRAKFLKYRNMNAVLAGMGIFMVLFACVGGVYMFQGIFTEPKIRGYAISGVVMSLWLIVFIGLATMPAWQLASAQTKTLNKNAPALMIDHNGVVDNVSNYMLSRISWSEVENVIVTSRYAPNINKTFPGVAIVMKNKNTLLRKKNKIIAMWMQVDTEIRDERQIFIPQGRLETPVEELVKQINDLRKRVTA